MWMDILTSSLAAWLPPIQQCWNEHLWFGVDWWYNAGAVIRQLIKQIKSPISSTNSSRREKRWSTQRGKKKSQDRVENSTHIWDRPGTHSGCDNHKSLRLLTVLEEFAAKKTCAVGLQYRARVLVRLNEHFTAAYKNICQKAEQELL